MEIKFINGNCDDFVRSCFKGNPNTAISWFLICSYCYYCRFESLMSDTAFDKMCSWMLSNFDKLEHVNKSLVTKEMLQAGTAFNLKADDYPLRIKVIGEEFIKLKTLGELE